MPTNELAAASSPYLLQHSANPVHWKQWSPQALEIARAENKPILLSIGYAACHWCHVMAHESFEDESTADLMNNLYVNIKVDREERPDIDQVYMAALHAMGQQGGWPLTMFLTPKGEAFWGGTYFPKSAAYGRPSFAQVLTQVANAFRTSPSQIEDNANRLRAAISHTRIKQESASITDETLTAFAQRLYSQMDDIYGGLQGAPKFPNTQIIEFFFRRAQRTGNDSFLAPAIRALEGMCRGGIRDHVGGGFARYSVDEKWFIPHFEKMLYDNAQILEQLCLGWIHTNSPEFYDAAESLVTWLRREMREPSNMFASSLDADSEGVEGKYYCWSSDELIGILTNDELEILRTSYNLKTEGNWVEHHTGIRTNVLSQHERDIPETTDGDAIQIIKQKMLAIRNLRIPPTKDDKILADWNALTISALARAATTFKRDDWLDLAHDCFCSVIESMTEIQNETWEVAHSLRNERLVKPGMASDYAYLIRAAIVMHECGAKAMPATPTRPLMNYLSIARELSVSLIRNYADPDTGLLTLSSRDAGDVLYRHITTADDAIPNPNSIFIQCLQILETIEDGNQFHDHARKMIASITGAALSNPFGHASFLNAADGRMNSFEIIVCGPESNLLADTAREGSFLDRFVVNAGNMPGILPERFRSENDSARAYICRNESCSLPLTTPAAIRNYIASQRARSQQQDNS